MTLCRGSRGMVPLILKLGNRRTRWPNSHPDRLICWKERDAHWMAGWVGPRNSLEVMENKKKKTPFPPSVRKPKPDRWAHNQGEKDEYDSEQKLDETPTFQTLFNTNERDLYISFIKQNRPLFDLNLTGLLRYKCRPVEHGVKFYRELKRATAVCSSADTPVMCVHRCVRHCPLLTLNSTLLWLPSSISLQYKTSKWDVTVPWLWLPTFTDVISLEIWQDTQTFQRDLLPASLG